MAIGVLTAHAADAQGLQGLLAPDAIGGDLIAATRAQDLYLEVILGEQPTGMVIHVRLDNGRILVAPDDLAAVGVVVPAGTPVETDGLVSLDAVSGLSYTYDAARQQLILRVPTGMRPLQELGYTVPPPASVRRDSGLVFAYDTYARGIDGDATLGVRSTVNWFGPFGRLESSGVSRGGRDGEGYRRLDTFWTYGDPTRLWTWTAGDFVTGGLPWTRPVRMAGLQWRRDFGVRPDLITIPMPHFSSAAAVPSTVELYVNNVKQFGTEVQDGPFVLDALPRISGAGTASLLVTDALGRTTETTVPLYVDNLRLAPGLQSFSLEAGLLRRGFAGPDDTYSDSPAASATWRRGILTTLTLEAHGEAARGLRAAGAGVVWSPWDRLGVASASYSASGADRTGHQYTAGYQFNNRRLGFDVEVMRRTDAYRDVADLDMVHPADIRAARDRDRATAWMPIGRSNLALTILRWRDADRTEHQTRSLTLSGNVGSRTYVSTSVFNDTDGGWGGGVSLSVPLGPDVAASTAVRRSRQGASTSASLWNRAPYDGGWGWRLQGGTGDSDYLQAAVELRSRAGEALAGVERRDGRTGAFFQGGGSLVFMDGQLLPSRPIHDAFAVVSTDGIAGVPVLNENRLYGRTNGAGYLLVPDLRGWQANRLAIDPDALGAPYQVGDVEERARPAEGAGILVAFDVTRVVPALVTLLGPDGEPLPAGTQGRLVPSGATVLVGFDGLAYIEDAAAGATIEVDVEGSSCRYIVPPANPDTVPGTPLRLRCTGGGQ